MNGIRVWATIALLALVTIAGSASAQSRPTYPIGYISVGRLLSEADDAKAASKEIESLRDAKTKALTALKQSLDATRLQLANSGGYFSSSKRAELTATVKRQEAELQQASQQAQVELQDLQRKVQDRLRGELNAVVTQLARERGYQYVLNQDTALVIAPTGASLTDDVLARLNAAAAQRDANAKAVAEAAQKKN